MNFQFRFQLYMINFVPEKKVHFVLDDSQNNQDFTKLHFQETYSAFAVLLPMTSLLSKVACFLNLATTQVLINFVQLFIDGREKSWEYFGQAMDSKFSSAPRHFQPIRIKSEMVRLSPFASTKDCITGLAHLIFSVHQPRSQGSFPLLTK